MSIREDFIAAARARIGTVWRHQGRDENGLDCVGLVVVAARAVGIEGQDLPNYSRANISQFRKRIYAHTEPVRGVPRSGDLVIIREHIAPIHIGILVIEDGVRSIIHASTFRRSVVEDPMDAEVDERVIAYRAIAGME